MRTQPSQGLRIIPLDLQADTGVSGIAGAVHFLCRTSQGLLTDHAVAVLVSERHAQVGPSYTMSLSSTLTGPT
jgi:hypothetical protein